MSTEDESFEQLYGLIAFERDKYPRDASDMDSGELADVILKSSWLEGERARVRAEIEESEWQYGCANFGDLDDVITVPGPLALQGKTEREWAEGVLQPEYGDLLVRRRKAGSWTPVHTNRGERDG